MRRKYRHANERRRHASLSVSYRHSVDNRLEWPDILRHFGLVVETATRFGTVHMQCPFHDGTHPSLKVPASRNRPRSYQCYACGMGGDKVDFILDMVGIRTVRVREKKRCIEGIISQFAKT